MPKRFEVLFTVDSSGSRTKQTVSAKTPEEAVDRIRRSHGRNVTVTIISVVEV